MGLFSKNSYGRLKRVQHFIQHAKFAMLGEMLDLFKRADFIQHFVKEKNHVGCCWMKFVPEHIFHPAFSCIQRQKYLFDSFKVAYRPTFNSQHHFEC